MFFRDVLDEMLNEFHHRNCFDNKLLVFVAIVMECDIFFIVIINA